MIQMNDTLALTAKGVKIKKLKTTRSYVIPYLIWCFIFIAIPALILIFLAFSNYDFSLNQEVTITFKNWSYVFGSEYARVVFWPAIGRSFLISFIVTIGCLLLGY